MPEITLSNDQMNAVLSQSRAIVVSAGAGSGKTEVVAHRIERLLSESAGEDFQILAVSFTYKAADELRERFVSRLGDLQRRVNTDTIHGFALSLLRQHGTRIGLPGEPELLTRIEDRAELLDSWLRDSGQSPPEDPRAVFGQIDLARARCVDVPYLADWRAALNAAGALDYAAMLDRAYELTQDVWMSRHLKRVYEHVVVDEAQNLTEAQYRLIMDVIGQPESDHLSAVIVGDQRQSIVGFAGADASLMDRFAVDYGADRIELNTNYRSARVIIEVGQAVAKVLDQPTNSAGQQEFPARGFVGYHASQSEREEGEFVAAWIARLLTAGIDEEIVAPGESTSVKAEQIGVLARSAASLQFVRDALTRIGIDSATASTEDDWVASMPARSVVELVAYRSAPSHQSTRRRLAELSGNPDMDWDDVRDLIACDIDQNIKSVLSLGTAHDLASFVERVQTLDIDDIDWPDDLHQILDAWQGFSDRTATSERSFGNFRQHIARCQRGDSMDPGVRLLTIHKSQGREFKAVVVIACNEGQIPDFRAKASDEIAAELRTFYVATTRASRCLFLTRSNLRQSRSGPWTTEPSRFLKYLSDIL